MQQYVVAFNWENLSCFLSSDVWISLFDLSMLLNLIPVLFLSMYSDKQIIFQYSSSSKLRAQIWRKGKVSLWHLISFPNFFVPISCSLKSLSYFPDINWYMISWAAIWCLKDVLILMHCTPMLSFSSLQNKCDILQQRWRRDAYTGPSWNVNARSCTWEQHRAWR